jgi:hypothetical protein
MMEWSAPAFKKAHGGLTSQQFDILKRLMAKDIARSNFGRDSSLHLLIKKGYAELVAMGTGRYGDDVLRITEAGRERMRSLLALPR